MKLQYLVTGFATLGLGAALGYALQGTPKSALGVGVIAMGSSAIGMTLSRGNQQEQQSSAGGLSDLQTQRSQLEDEIQSLTQQLAKLPQQLKQTEAEVQTATEQKAAIEQSITQLQAEQQQLEEQRHDDGGGLSEHHQQLEDLRAQILELETTRETLEQNIQEKQEKELAVQAVLADRLSEVEQLQTQVVTYQSQQAELEQQIADFREQLQDVSPVSSISVDDSSSPPPVETAQVATEAGADLGLGLNLADFFSDEDAASGEPEIFDIGPLDAEPSAETPPSPPEPVQTALETLAPEDAASAETFSEEASQPPVSELTGNELLVNLFSDTDEPNVVESTPTQGLNDSLSSSGETPASSDADSVIEPAIELAQLFNFDEEEPEGN